MCTYMHTGTSKSDRRLEKVFHVSRVHSDHPGRWWTAAGDNQNFWGGCSRKMGGKMGGGG